MVGRFTIIGDPHVKNSNLDVAWELFHLVEEQGLPAIWLGDLLDTKEVIRGKSLNTWVDYFKSSKLKHYVLVGNHDWFNLDCKDHSLEALKLLPNVAVIDKPTQFVNLPFYMIPYIHDQDELKKALKEAPDNSVLIAHLELKGFDFGNGYICKEGLTKTSFRKFKRVISGHFHKYQEDGNLMYLGTPFSHSFGEAGQKKFICLYDADEDRTQLIGTPHRRHVSYELNCDNPDHLKQDFSAIHPGNLYRIILTGKQENIDKFPRHQLDGKSVKWITRPTDHGLNDVTIEDTVSNEKQFERWATEIQRMDAETIKMGLEIMKAVR